jgi:DNA invertase Pin-like site-specific DNA recombinase
VYVDAGVSGGTPIAQRPRGAGLLAAIERGDVTAIVALKLDRLFRSTLDCLQSVEAWDRRRVSLHLIDFNGGTLDTRSAMGRFFLTMAAGFAEMERALIGERTSAALQHLKRQGVRLGGAPFGFRAVEPGGALEPDPGELAIVAEILRLRGTGAPGDTLTSLRAIAHHLTTAGHRTRHGGPWTPEIIRKILARRGFYDRCAGLAVNGTVVPVTAAALQPGRSRCGDLAAASHS